MEDFCGLPTERDLQIIEEISSLHPSLQKLSSSQTGGDPENENNTNADEPSKLDYIIAAAIYCACAGVSFAGASLVFGNLFKDMTPEGLLPPCPGANSKPGISMGGVLQFLGAVTGVAKPCKLRQQEFDEAIAEIKMTANSLGILFALGVNSKATLDRLANWIHSSRKTCGLAGGRRKKNRGTKRRSNRAKKGRKNRKTKSRR